VDDKHAIIHNGTITKIKIAKDDRRSDTKIFATEYLANLPEGWEHNGVIAELIEEFIGYSKVCMLSVDTGITIFNESMGHWLDGIWYSNKSYIKATYTYKAPAAPVAVGYNNMYNHAYWWEKAAADDTIVGDDAEHWAPKQTTIPPVIPPIKETHLTSTESQQVLPLHGYEECDLCGDYNHANDLVKLSLGGIQIITCLNCVVSEPAFYCDACHEHTACNSVEISTDEGQQFGSKDLEAEDVYLCDDCLEMYKTAGFKIRIIESVMDAITKLAAKKW
jgi:hypothetical protein